MPAAPATRDGRSRGKLTSPHQVLAGVPRALDALVVRVLAPTPTRPAPTRADRLADAIAGAVRADAPRPVAVPEPRLPPALQRRLPLLAAVAFLLAVGLGSYAVGREVGEIPPVDDPLAGVSSPEPGAPAGGTRIDLAVVSVDDFDPPPGGGDEQPGAVPNAFDDDPSTAWETERYDSADFGGLKPGVGLLVDLGRPTKLSRVELMTRGGGVTYELRAADALGARAEDYRVVARGKADQESLVLSPSAPATARWYLVWITGLAEDDGGFRAAVREMRFLRG